MYIRKIIIKLSEEKKFADFFQNKISFSEFLFLTFEMSIF